MRLLINLAMYMIILSGITLSTSLAEVAVYMIVSAAVFFLGHQLMKLVYKVELVHEYTITHTERHHQLERDLERIEHDVEEMKKKFEDFDVKLDKIMNEVRK